MTVVKITRPYYSVGLEYRENDWLHSNECMKILLRHMVKQASLLFEGQQYLWSGTLRLPAPSKHIWYRAPQSVVKLRF